MAAKTKREFLTEKLHNFASRVKVMTDVNDNEIKGAGALIAELEASVNNLELFVASVTQVMKPFEGKMELLLEQYLSKHGIDVSLLKPQDKTLIVRYLDMFTKIL